MPSEPRPWDIALVGASAPHAFVLFVVGNGLCRTRLDFESHFVDGGGAWYLAEEMSKTGFIEINGGCMRLTEHGASLVRSIHLSVSNEAGVHENLMAPSRRSAASTDRHVSDTYEPPRKRKDSTGDGSLVGAGVGSGRRSTILGGTPDPLMGYQVVLYSRAVHPDLLPGLKARRVIRHGEYEFEAWVMEGMHLLRFGHNAFSACELLAHAEMALPTNGVVNLFLCSAEHDFEHRFARERITYMTSVHAETLSDSLYAATYGELIEFAKESDSLTHRWGNESGKCLSMVDVQRMNKEVHVQGYHMIAEHGLVLRTQTIFELGS